MKTLLLLFAILPFLACSQTTSSNNTQESYSTYHGFVTVFPESDSSYYATLKISFHDSTAVGVFNWSTIYPQDTALHPYLVGDFHATSHVDIGGEAVWACWFVQNTDTLGHLLLLDQANTKILFRGEYVNGGSSGHNIIATFSLLLSN